MSAASTWADLGERAAWTLLQAGIGEEAVHLVSWPQWAVAPIAMGLALIKGALASKFGKGTAATLPAKLEATPPAPAPAAPA